MKRFIKMEWLTIEYRILPFSGIEWRFRYSAGGQFRIYYVWYG